MRDDTHREQDEQDDHQRQHEDHGHVGRMAARRPAAPPGAGPPHGRGAAARGRLMQARTHGTNRIIGSKKPVDEKTIRAIAALRPKLNVYGWGLYDGKIRQPAIEEGTTEPELRLSPVGTLATHRDEDLINGALAGPENTSLREAVQRWLPATRRLLADEDPAMDAAELAEEALAHAVGAAVENDPAAGASTGLIGFDQTTVEVLTAAADDPTSETGRALVTALASENSNLRAQYEARFGCAPEDGPTTDEEDE